MEHNSPFPWLSFARYLTAKVQAAAEDVAKQAKKGGLSEESVEAIRKHILGIAS
ncbi:DUF3486 family protein [Neisseria chenwenguii]|uniref:DUF3486 family protein n=1 Tax=Neisseria chenwenguii TaxID=1853278 RepID=UPI001E486DD4|nr:DUF3486 family protein [Neisseria chenwenguii]